ncbi:MAG: PAS domain-containing protein [Proteobacteria bacterium]|nr:PAS domain-containing protein [Pseudomonadota bacterium]
MKRERIFAVGSMVGIAILIAFIAIYGDHHRTRQQRIVESQAKIIATSLWLFDPGAPEKYLELACQDNNYKKLVVTSYDNRVFVSVGYDLENPIGSILADLNIIPVVILNSEVSYQGKRIGTLTVDWYNTVVYAYGYVATLIMLLLIIFWYVLGSIAHRRALEERVAERTYSLEKANWELQTEMTTRISAEEETHRLRNLLANIIDSMPSLIIGVDPEGKVTQWNREAEITTGVKVGEALGGPLVDVFPAISKEMVKISQAMIQKESLKDTRVPIDLKGDDRLCDITVYPLVANGVEGAVIRIDDVTERIRIEEMMIQSEKMMSVGGLAAGMAHEINNPLGGILQGVQNIVRRLSPDFDKNLVAAEECGIDLSRVNRYLEKRQIVYFIEGIQASGERASQIIQNMLSFSRKSSDHSEACSVSKLLDKTVDLAASDYDLKKKFDFRAIKIVREYEATLPSILCEGGKIQQVFLNILKNGAQAMIEKSKTLEEKEENPQQSKYLPQFILRTVSENRMVRIEIEDNGTGMDESVRKRAFEPFFTTKEVGTGTGLGLSVSYFIVTENHNGTMTVESVPSGGSNFIIRLPLQEMAQ